MKTLLHRCCVGLGLLAMAVALWAIPATVGFALAKVDMAAAATTDAMPCKHDCPDCPKPCPDLGGCLLKCFQPLSAPPAQAKIHQEDVRGFVPRAPSQVTGGALIPPLLRPPSV